MNPEVTEQALSTDTRSVVEMCEDQLAIWWEALWPALRARWAFYLNQGDTDAAEHWFPELLLTPKNCVVGYRVGSADAPLIADPAAGHMAILLMTLAAALTEGLEEPHVITNPDVALSRQTVMKAVKALQGYPGNVMLMSLYTPSDTRPGKGKFRGDFDQIMLDPVE